MKTYMYIHSYTNTFHSQAQYWINERMQTLDDDTQQGSTDIQSKLKLLQKHQVFEAEILAHEKTIQDVTEVN